MPSKATTSIDTGIYARISFDRRDGAGIERQLTDCRAYATDVVGLRESTPTTTIRRGGWAAAALGMWNC